MDRPGNKRERRLLGFWIVRESWFVLPQPNPYTLPIPGRDKFDASRFKRAAEAGARSVI
jgi:hypothetical protein